MGNYCLEEYPGADTVHILCTKVRIPQERMSNRQFARMPV